MIGANEPSARRMPNVKHRCPNASQSPKGFLTFVKWLIRSGNPLVGHSIEIVQLPRCHRQFQFQRVDCAVFGIDNALAIGIEIGPAPVLALDERLAIGVQKKMPLPIDLMQEM